jgi:hypothetical protein
MPRSPKSAKLSPTTGDTSPSLAATKAVAAEVVNAIIQEMEIGNSLRSCCAKPGRPSIWKFLRMLEKDRELSQQYARAREIQADYLASECVEIADEDPDPARARVRVDARKWYASKLKPKVYGDKIDLTTTGEHLFGQGARSHVDTLLAQADELRRRSRESK